jgi:site-specific recombinase XerD
VNGTGSISSHKKIIAENKADGSMHRYLILPFNHSNNQQSRIQAYKKINEHEASHNIGHSFVTHSMESGFDIRSFQELPGSK